MEAIFYGFGFDHAISIVLLLAFGVIGRWMASNVVKPLVNGHLDHLKAIERNNDRQTETLGEIARTQEELVRTQEHIIHLLEEKVRKK